MRVGTHGAGQITVISFSVPAGSLGFWRRRLTQAGIRFTDENSAFNEGALRLKDPSGLTIRLVESAGDARAPWRPPDLDANTAIRGIRVRTPAVGRYVYRSAGSISALFRIQPLTSVNPSRGNIDELSGADWAWRDFEASDNTAAITRN